MKKSIKKVIAVLLGLIFISVIIVVAMKPNEQDFNNWLTKKYSIECTYGQCEQIDFIKKDQSVIPLKLKSSEDSKGIFSYYAMRVYYNTGTDERFSVKAKGMLGHFWVIDEQKRFR